jgi:hypothetical protein
MSRLSNFIDRVATVEVLQWWRRLDLAESGELLMFRALRREMVKKYLERC